MPRSIAFFAFVIRMAPRRVQRYKYLSTVPINTGDRARFTAESGIASNHLFQNPNHS
jgi:hypothetical protein